MSVRCRRASASDTAVILEVHRAAFAEDVEADLVSALLADSTAQPVESWVAEVGGVVVGHVLLTPGEVPQQPHLPVLLLCPLAVLPSHQHAGVGAAVTRAAIAAATDAGVRAVCVFGDPGYYSRFGFQSLLPDGPVPPYPISAQHQDAWQTLLVSDGPTTADALRGARIEWATSLMTPALWES